MRYRPLLAAVAAMTLATLSACSDTGEGTVAESAERSLSDVIGSAQDLSKFAKALEKTGLDGIFEGPANYTVLAPDDRAFEKLGDAVEAPVLAAIVREHILPGTVMPEDIKASLEKAGGKSVSMATLGSDAITFAREDGRIVATSGDGRKAVLSDSPVRAANGVVIPVDAILRDPGAPEA